MNSLTFNATKLHPVQQNDSQIWLTGGELATALGYARVDSLNKVYERNADEFTNSMTQNVILTLSNKNNELQEVKTRIFSLRGCHLIAMFARTSVAKEFRKWVLDVLDKEVGQPIQVPAIITLEQQQAIKDAVIRKAQRDKRTYQSIYRDFYNTFDIPRYQELPLAKFDEALKWLGDGWYSNKKQSPNFESHAHNTASHMLWVSRWWYCYRDAIRLLNPKMAGEIHDHFMDGAFSAGLTLGADRSKQLDSRIQRDYPYQLGQSDLIDFFRQR